MAELGKLTQNNVADSKKSSLISNEMGLQFKGLTRSVASLVILVQRNSSGACLGSP
jgi:hypothetical protein